MTKKQFMCIVVPMLLLSASTGLGKQVWRLALKERPAQQSDKFCLITNQRSVVPLKFAAKHANKTLRWILTDYCGKRVKSGQLRVNDNGEAKLQLTLPTGWYKLFYPELKYSSGIAVNQPAPASKDPYFCVDAVLTWEIPAKCVMMRQNLVNTLKWMGVYGSRERLDWRAANKKPGKFDFATWADNESLTEMYRKAGIKMLVTFHNTPKIIKAANSLYPRDLVYTAKSWRKIVEHYQGAWDSFEIWNEPDVKFGAFLPADQYAPMAKAISYALTNDGSKVLIGGGVTATAQQDFVNNLGENGVFNLISMYSFHNYIATRQMPLDIVTYRRILSKYHKGAMPLWITEAGITFDLPGRDMNINEYRINALNMVSKSVEARAYGIARFYPFIFPYWVSHHSKKHATMTHRDLSAGMGTAAYGHAIRRLSGTKYLGTVKNLAKNVYSRVFGSSDGKNAIVVLYADAPDVFSAVKIPFPAGRIEGIDGRLLGRNLSKVNLSDGMAYVMAPFSSIKKYLASNGEAMKYYRVAAGPDFKYNKPVPSPYIIYPMPSRRDLKPRTNSWRLDTSKRDLKVKTNVFNLSKQAYITGLTAVLESPGYKSRKIRTAVKKIASGSSREFIITIPKTELKKFVGEAKLTLTCTAPPIDGYRKPAPAVMTIEFKRTLASTLKQYPKHHRLAIEKRQAWRLDNSRIKTGGKITVKPGEEGRGIKFVVSFKPKRKMDEWFYPELKVPAGVRLQDYDALLIRAKSMKKPKPTLYHVSIPDPYPYKTRNTIMPSDGEYHTVLVKFGELAVPRWTPRQDPDDRFNPERVKAMGIGFGNYRYPQAELSFSDVYLIKTGK